MADKHWSWASAEWSVIREGKPAVIHSLIRSVAYGDGAETVLVHGAGRYPLGVTDSIYMPGEITIEMLAKWFRIFVADATENGAVALGDLQFKLVVKYQSRTDTDPTVDEIDFVITGADDSGTQGSADPLVTSVKGQITRILRNGVQL